MYLKSNNNRGGHKKNKANNPSFTPSIKTKIWPNREVVNLQVAVLVSE
ncbi:hypothetical protein POKO110462_16280 [Pontibacter korlensis]